MGLVICLEAARTGSRYFPQLDPGARDTVNFGLAHNETLMAWLGLGATYCLMALYWNIVQQNRRLCRRLARAKKNAGDLRRQHLTDSKRLTFECKLSHNLLTQIFPQVVSPGGAPPVRQTVEKHGGCPWGAPGRCAAATGQAHGGNMEGAMAAGPFASPASALCLPCASHVPPMCLPCASHVPTDAVDFPRFSIRMPDASVCKGDRMGRSGLRNNGGTWG